MKKNIIALKTFYKDGTSYLYGNLDFYKGDELSELLALMLAAYEAKNYLSDERVDIDKITLCYVDAEWNFEVAEDKIIDEYPLTSSVINTLLSNPMPKITTTGKTLEILPDACYNIHLRKKLRKIRKNGRCIDWKKQNSNTEWDNNSWWYLHGELVSKVAFDKAIVINATEADVTVPTIRWRRIEGNNCTSYDDIPHREIHLNEITKCNVIGVHGDCLGFFWTTDEKTVNYDKGSFSFWNQRGLVVQRDDIHGVLQAYHAYIMQKRML